MFKNLLLIKLFLFTSLTVNANSKIHNFEGSIKLKKETVFDTSFITLQVKGNFVRINELNKNKEIQSSYIVNLDEETVLVLSPSRKLYSEVKNILSNQKEEQETQIIKSGNCMEYNGFHCSQMRVKCKARDTEIAFWVTDEKFDFFNSLVNILKKTNINIDMFNLFPEIEGGFPILTVDRTLLRKERMRLAVDDIKEGYLSEIYFKIPPDFRKLER